MAAASRPTALQLLSIVSMLILAADAAWSADASSYLAGGTDVSDGFRQQIQTAAATIPDPIWRSLTARGWQLRLAHSLSEAAPDLRAQRPRGWPGDRSWDSVEAVHLPRSRTLIIAEKLRGKDGLWQTNQRAAGVLRHEVGHAFDMFAGGQKQFLSATSGFRKAYDSDVAVMDTETRSSLNYFLQRDFAGRQETFAEAFAIELGGGSDTKHIEAFRNGFPRVLHFQRAAIEKYALATNLKE